MCSSGSTLDIWLKCLWCWHSQCQGGVMPRREDSVFTLTHQHVYAYTHTDRHSHGRQKLLYVGMRGSSPSLIPVELSTAHPAECVSIAAGHAVRGTVCVSHRLQGRDFWNQSVHRCMALAMFVCYVRKFYVWVYMYVHIMPLPCFYLNTNSM